MKSRHQNIHHEKEDCLPLNIGRELTDLNFQYYKYGMAEQAIRPFQLISLVETS